MADYITVEQLREYAGFAADDFYTETRLEEAIAMACIYVDVSIGRGTPDDTTGQLFNKTLLRPFQVTALERATAAQAEYILVKGPEFFTNQRPDRVVGPDGVAEGKETYLAPKAKLELTRGRLFKLTSIPGGRGDAPWLPRA